MPDEFLLLTALQAAVPMSQFKIRYWTPEQRQAFAVDLADQLAAHGDDLLYGGKHCAATFAALADAIAIGSLQPGGIGFAGLHWCALSGHHGIRGDTPCAAEYAREERDGPTTPPPGRPAPRDVVTATVQGDVL